MTWLWLVLLLTLGNSIFPQDGTLPQEGKAAFITEIQLPWQADQLLWSPDGRFLAVNKTIIGDENGATWIYALPDLRLISETDYGGTGARAWWSDDSQYLAIRVNYDETRIMDVTRSDVALTLSGETYWRPGSAWIAEAESGSLQVFRLSDGALQYDLDFIGYPWKPVWSPDGTLLALRESRGTIRVVEAETGLPVAERTELDGNLRLDWSPDSQRVVIHDIDRRTTYLWTLATGDLLPIYNTTSDLLWSPEGTQIAAGHDFSKVRIWAVDTGELLTTLRDFEAPARPVEWQDHRLLVYSADSLAGLDDSVTVWNTQTGEQHLFIDPPDYINHMTFLDDRLLYRAIVGPLTIYDLPSGRVLRSLDLPDNMAITRLSPCRQWLLYARGQTAKLYETTTGRIIALNPISARIWRDAWQPDDRALAFTDEANRLYLWELTPGN